MLEELDLEIFRYLAAYLAGEISLEQFRDWFDASAWQSEKSSDEAAQVTSTVELRLAEYSNGHWTENELREQLFEVVRASPELLKSLAQLQIATGSTSVTVSPQFQVQYADITPLKVSA